MRSLRKGINTNFKAIQLYIESQLANADVLIKETFETKLRARDDKLIDFQGKRLLTLRKS